MRPSALTVAALHLLVLTTWPLAADLDPAIQADLHLVQAEDYITQKNYAAAAEALGKIFALQEQHDLTIPDEFHFKYAQVLHMAGEYEEAVSAVTHYLKIAGRVATHYRDSLSLLHTATQAAERAAEAVAAIAKAEAAAKAEAEARAEAAARARAAAVEVARNIAMVVVPAGSYLMGSPSSEEGRIQQHEGPQHWVTIREAFAVGVYEVTFDEWDACVSAGGCGGYVPDDAGWGRGRRPVIHVSWEDAQRFVAWLRRETGEPYRLLTEAEWEYVARAGSSAARYWGDSSSAQCRYSNGADQSLKRHSSGATVAACDDGYYRTAPVGEFSPNEHGLYDVLGNVGEWVKDCWRESYIGAPDDGSAWERGDCSLRVVRGGSWTHSPDYVRSAYRDRGGKGVRWNSSTGFRVARTLAP